MVKTGQSIFLFLGKEEYLKERALEKLKFSLLDERSRELNYRVFRGGDDSARDILDYASTLPLSGSKKLLAIKDVEKMSEEDKTRLGVYAKNPSSHTYLVLDIKDDAILNKYGFIGRHTKIAKYDNLKGRELSEWIKDYVSRDKKKIEEDAIELLVESKGGGLLCLARELEKFIAFVGDRETIKLEDVEHLVGKSLISPVFDIAWAVGEEDISKAMRLAAELLSSGKNSYEIIGILGWHLKRILKAKVLQAEGESDGSIAGRLGIGQAHFKDFFKNLVNFDVAKVRLKLGILLKTDLEIKRSRLNPALSLELAIIRLCLG